MRFGGGVMTVARRLDKNIVVSVVVQRGERIASGDEDARLLEGAPASRLRHGAYRTPIPSGHLQVPRGRESERGRAAVRSGGRPDSSHHAPEAKPLSLPRGRRSKWQAATLRPGGEHVVLKPRRDSRVLTRRDAIEPRSCAL